jgi:hypothetical protein
MSTFETPKLLLIETVTSIDVVALGTRLAGVAGVDAHY